MINATQIKLLVYDFDGVMTDNRVLVDENGKESVIVHRGDGYAVSQIFKLGINQIILSTERNDVVTKRGKKLNLDVIHGVEDKKTILLHYCKKKQIQLKNVMFIGNDLNDYECMKCVGLKGCPADAECEILEIADWIAKSKGGYGVIRELLRELTIKS